MALEEYKLEQKELFSQYKKDLKSISEGQGVWLSSKAWVWAIVIVFAHLAYWVIAGEGETYNKHLIRRETSPF